MDRNFYEEYMQIAGQTELGVYRSAEEEAQKIEKCTILKSVDISYSNEIVGYNFTNDQYVMN